MALVQVSDENLDELHEGLQALQAIPKRSTGSGGGSYDGVMEHRLTQLEAFADDAKQRLVRVETKLDHIDKEVGQVKWWIIAQIVAGLLAVLGTGIAIQQMTVSTFQAAGAQATQASPPQAQQPIIINVPGATPATASPTPQQ